MECFGAFYNYSQQPSPQMYFSWKYTKLFVPRSVMQALHEKKKKLDVLILQNNQRLKILH